MNDTPKTKTEVFTTENEAMDYLVCLWGQLAQEAISDHRRFSVALCGGKTPVPFYKKLETIKDYPWDKTHIFLTDDRFVSLDHRDSNFRLVSQIFTVNDRIPVENFYPIDYGKDIEQLAVDYEEKLRQFFKIRDDNFPVFDLMIMGLGEDGHTASLFPEQPALAEKKSWAVAVDYDRVEQKRITLTLPVINNSRQIVFFVTGQNKADILKQISTDTGNSYPASLVHPIDGQLSFVLDSNSAAKLYK